MFTLASPPATLLTLPLPFSTVHKRVKWICKVVKCDGVDGVWLEEHGLYMYMYNHHSTHRSLEHDECAYDEHVMCM